MEKHWVRRRVLGLLGGVALLISLVGGVALAQAQVGPAATLGTSFTYQGELRDGDTPAAGPCDFQFSLWDASDGGLQQGTTQTVAGKTLSGGRFTVLLDFGAQFTGAPRWLQVAVRCPAGAGDYVTLSPRQALTGVPYALYALGASSATSASTAPWSGLTGVPVGFADGVDNDTAYTAGTGLNLSANQFLLAPPYRLPQACLGGQVAIWNATSATWVCADQTVGGDITGVTAGTGLTGGGSSGDVTLGVNFTPSGGANGVGTTVTRGDHNHDSTYVNEGQAASIGASMLVDGAALAEIADDDGVGSGLDADTLDGQHAAAFAASAHNHWGQTWTGSGVGLNLESSGDTGLSASGNLYAIVGTNPSTAGVGVYGGASSASGPTHGVYGINNSTEGYGVTGHAMALSGTTFGVYGSSRSPDGTGVRGAAFATSGSNIGVYGSSASSSGKGVYGSAAAASGVTYGVHGRSVSPDGWGVFGEATAATGASRGVTGSASSDTGTGVHGSASAVSGATYGVWGGSNSTTGTGVAGYGYASTGTNYGVYGGTNSPDGYAGYFAGKVSVSGTLSKGAGSFKIDHPLDPENKYLYHSFVESPDMMNIYNGNVVTDANGEATVVLPDYFEALNREFRYQLTPIGQFAQAIVLTEIEGNNFVVKTDKPNVKVSWQVTGVRRDAFAESNRIPVEEYKPEAERGTYLYPAALGKADSLGRDFALKQQVLAGSEADER